MLDIIISTIGLMFWRLKILCIVSGFLESVWMLNPIYSFQMYRFQNLNKGDLISRLDLKLPTDPKFVMWLVKSICLILFQILIAETMAWHTLVWRLEYSMEIQNFEGLCLVFSIFIYFACSF